MSRRSALLRPAPTASRPPNHFPGPPVIGRHRFPPPAAAGPRRLSPVPRTTIRTFNAQYAGGFFSARFRIPGAFHGLRRRLNGSAPSHCRQPGGLLDDACSGFTHVADRTVASAPLRTRPLDHARGPRYQGPGRLPGPDSHRQAILNLSLGLRHVELLFFKRPSSLGAPGDRSSERARMLSRDRIEARSRPSRKSRAWLPSGATCS